MNITITYGSRTPRKKPKVGDRRTTKKHGEQVRVFEQSQGCYVVSNGRPCYQWVPVSDAKEHMADHHWTAEERAKYDSHMQRRGAT
jgi:hypothetical protein